MTCQFKAFGMQCVFQMYILFHVPTQLGKGLSQYPGGLLPGATQVNADEPFKR